MGNFLRVLLAVSLIAGIWSGCGKDDDSAGLNFSGPARETIPVMSTSTTSLFSLLERSALADNWSNGNLFYEMWYTFADASQPAPTAGGSWGSENLFNNIALADSYTQGFQCKTELNRSITAPLTLGAETYECGMDSDAGRIAKVAYTRAGDLTKALITSKGDLDQLVMMGSYNSATGDLTLKVVTYVAYDTENKFIMRMDAVGNTNTHAFTVQYSKRNPKAGYYNMDIAGKGIAKGDGNHFLLRMREWDSGNAKGTDKFYCYPAGVTVASLQSKTEASDLKADASTFADCASYKDDVENTTTLPYLADSDLPTEAMDLAIF